MKLRPSENLTQQQVRSGLRYVVKDGLAAEAMATLTGGAFLVAMALSMGASNFQIGMLAALPSIGNVFQLAAVWLVQKYKNRRAIIVVCALFGRFPLFIIGFLPFVFKAETSMQILVFLMLFHYFLASLVGTSWNSWMKDLVPGKIMGSYFSHRSRLIQIVSVTLSLLLAVGLDHIKANYPDKEIQAYSVMFIAGGAAGMLGVYLLSRVPEPESQLVNDNVFKLLKKPLRDKNFRQFLMFNSFWAFSLNMATPFVSVYAMKTIGLSLSYLIGLNVLSQLTSILFVKAWGKYADKYSNKTIINICAPVYSLCILGWAFTGSPSEHIFNLPLLLLISVFSGISTAGINLSINNIAFKLAPKGEAIVYISARSMITSLFPAIAPIIGGLMADFFATHQLVWNIQLNSPSGNTIYRLLELQNWNYFFLIGSVLAMLSLRVLRNVKEVGEVEKKVVYKVIVQSLRFKRKISIRGEGFVPRSTAPL